MIARCYNPNSKYFSYYGGRGIAVCDQWREDFQTFLRDVGLRPPGTSIDRYPNGNGNYEPGNIRWATDKQQNLNRRSILHLRDIDDNPISLQDVAAHLAMSPITLRRLLRDVL